MKRTLRGIAHLLLAAAALAAIEARSGEIVSNLTEPYDFGAGLHGAFIQASSFTTDAQTYRLDSVTLNLDFNLPGTVALSVFSDNGGLPGVSLENLGATFHASGGEYDTVYSASGATLLQPNTRYWLVVEEPGGDPLLQSSSWVSTSSPAETSPSGVTIGNDMYYRPVGDPDWTATQIGPSFPTDTGQFAVNATAATIAFDDHFFGTGGIPPGWSFFNDFPSVPTISHASSLLTVSHTTSSFGEFWSDAVFATGTQVTVTGKIAGQSGVTTTFVGVGLGKDTTAKLRVSVDLDGGIVLGTKLAGVSEGYLLTTTFPGSFFDLTMTANANGVRVLTSRGYDSGVLAWSTVAAVSGFQFSSLGPTTNANVTYGILSPGSVSLDRITVAVDISPDTDGDGVPDATDNCTLVANPTQCDSESDGFGNHCDGDLNNNTFTNSQDFVLFRAQLGQPSVDPTYNQADLNCNGFVNSQDFVLFRGLLGSPPGPSAPIP